MIGARDLYANQVAEVSEYFVYFGTSAALSWVQRSGPIAKGGFFESPYKQKPRISEKLQHSRQKGNRKPNARMIALHILVTVRRILSIRPRYIRTGNVYSSAVYPFSFTWNPVPALVKDTHAHRASIDSRLKLLR